MKQRGIKTTFVLIQHYRSYKYTKKIDGNTIYRKHLILHTQININNNRYCFILRKFVGSCSNLRSHICVYKVFVTFNATISQQLTGVQFIRFDIMRNNFFSLLTVVIFCAYLEYAQTSADTATSAFETAFSYVNNIDKLIHIHIFQ